MSDATIPPGALSIPDGARRAARPSLFRLHLLETGFEFLRVLRAPSFSIPTLLFPTMFYVFFGVVFGGSRGGTSQATYLLATYGAFGVISPALFGFGVALATERSLGWLSLKRATPMPPTAYIVAKLVMCLLFASLVVATLFTIGAVLGHVVLPRAAWVSLAGRLVAGTLPFCAIGLAMGTYLPAGSAPAVVNLVYLPMSFLSGLWVPISMFPAWVKSIASFLPAYHLGQLALGSIGLSEGGSPLGHVIVLALFFLAGLGLAAAGLRHLSE